MIGTRRWRIDRTTAAVFTRTGAVVCMFGLSVLACGAPPDGPAPGARSFERMLFLEDSAATSANVSIGDVDADGHLDIVLVKGRHWPLVDFVLFGDGQGGFAPPRPVSPEADRSYSGALVDMDGDGDLDIVVSNDRPDPKIVHLNDGQGGFERGASFGVPEWSTRHLSVADLDGDDAPDVVLANRHGRGSGPSFACFGDGAGGFRSPCTPVSEGSATTITPADVNGDGAPDLVVPHRDGGQGFVYLNDGDGAFSDRIAFGPPDAEIRAAKAADFDADGVLDLVVIDVRSGPALVFGIDGGGFDVPVPLGDPEASPYSLAVVDVDMDGRTDILIGHVESQPVVYFNEGGRAFTAVPFGDAEGVAYGFAVGDLDEDGLLDIAIARSAARNVLYFGAVADATVAASSGIPSG